MLLLVIYLIKASNHQLESKANAGKFPPIQFLSRDYLLRERFLFASSKKQHKKLIRPSNFKLSFRDSDSPKNQPGPEQQHNWEGEQKIHETNTSLNYHRIPKKFRFQQRNRYSMLLCCFSRYSPVHVFAFNRAPFDEKSLFFVRRTVGGETNSFIRNDTWKVQNTSNNLTRNVY